jgi:glycosyltransferase involved in cell wall biosynthesis
MSTSPAAVPWTVASDAAASANRVLFITLHFPPSRDIGAHACEQIARYFPMYGWHPVVLTRPKHLIESFDPQHQRAFPGTIVEAGLLPHPLDFYRWLKARFGTRASTDAAQSATAAFAEPSRSRLRRWALSLLHTPDTYIGWLLPATITGLRAIRRESITHIMSSGPYWTNHLVGLALARLTGLTWTAHYRDPWNQVPQRKPVSMVSAAFERYLERLVVRRADSVVCVTETHARMLREAFSSEREDKFTTIPNGYDGAEWESSANPSQVDDDRFVITYPGTFAMGSRSPRPLFRALRELMDQGAIDAREVRVHLFGDCESAEGMSVRDIADQYGLAEVIEIGPPVSRAETRDRITRSQLLLLLAEGWALQIPGKTYEYLRAGRPILALTSEGALAELLRRTGGAVVAHPDDISTIASCVANAYRAWKKKEAAPTPDAALVATYDRRLLAGRYAALFGRG